MHRAWLGVLTAGLLIGCNTPMLESRLLSTTGKVIEGVPYYLPSTTVPYTITGQFVPVNKLLQDPELSAPSNQEYLVTVSLGKPEQAADPAAMLVLQYNAEEGTDDEFTIGVNEKYLLSDADATSTDRSGEISLKMLELVTEVAKGVTGLPSTSLFSDQGVKGLDALVKQRREACWQVLKPFTYTFNIPASDFLAALPVTERSGIEITGGPDAEPPAGGYTTTQQKVQEKLNALAVSQGKRVLQQMLNTGSKAEVIRRVALGLPAASKGLKDAGVDLKEADEATEYKNRGIWFRLMTPVTLELEIDMAQVGSIDVPKVGTCTLMTGNSSKPQRVVAADPLQVFGVSTQRAALVETKMDLTIADGVLIGTKVKKPSQLLAIATLPVEVVKKIVSIPSELLTFKIQQVQKEQGLTDAEAARLKAEIELLRQQLLLEQAQDDPNSLIE